MAAARHAVSRLGSACRASVILGLTCLSWIVPFATTCRADAVQGAGREDQLRAGYLLNFAKFVEWPAAKSSDPFTVCFIGASGIRDSFASGASGKQIGTRPIVIRTLEGRAPLAGCQMVYIEANQLASQKILPGDASAAMLTVSDGPDFIHVGGIIELFTESNRLRFSINLDNARRAGLRVSSSLLQLASKVEETAK
jgi:YfiR/HmsC-like